MRRQRPWTVFVRDIGPTYTFASEDAARRRAERLVLEEFVVGNSLVGNYGDVLVWNAADRSGFRHTRYRPDREPVVEVLKDGHWVPVPANEKCPHVSVQSTSRSGQIEALFVQCQIKGEHNVHDASWLNGKRRVTWTVSSDLDVSEVPESAKLEGRFISA